MRRIAHIKPFFIEIIFVLLIMTICAYIFISLFAETSKEANESKDKTSAIMYSQSNLELVANSTSLSEAKEKLSFNDENKSLINYDESWKPCEKNGKYVVETCFTENKEKNGDLVDVKVEVYKNSVNKKELVYEVGTKKYFAE